MWIQSKKKDDLAKSSFLIFSAWYISPSSGTEGRILESVVAPSGVAVYTTFYLFLDLGIYSTQ